MRIGRNEIRKALALVAVVSAAAFVVSCGRNWCIGPFGPCDQYAKMDPAKLAGYSTANSSNVCGWNSTGNPRNGLRISAIPIGGGFATLNVRVNTDISIAASGGTAPYQIALKVPSMGTITPATTARPDAGVSMWTFRPTLAGIACIKVMDRGMTIDTPCDTCWKAIVVEP